MRDAYIVTYPTGGSGTFISSLIYIYFDTPNEPLIFSEYGDAHNNDNEIYKKNWKNIDKSEIYSNRMLGRVEPKNKSLPFVVSEHFKFKRTQALEKYPNYCNIKITLTENDRELVSAFMFFKLGLRFYNNYSDSHFWAKFSNGSQSDPNNLNENELKFCINLIKEKDISEFSKFKEENFEKNLFPNNEFMLKFNDIIFNKNKVLNYLSEILERPTTSIVEQTYDNYIMVNKNLINCKCPWIKF